MSGFMLGNLTVEEMEHRLGITLTDEQRTRMSDIRCNDAQNIPEGQWHCFDIPFVVVCGSLDVVYMWRYILEPRKKELQTRIEFVIQN